MQRCKEKGCRSWGEYEGRCFTHSNEHDTKKKLKKGEKELKAWIDEYLGGDYSDFATALIHRLSI